MTNLHTVFGDLELKHDPTLDRLKWSNSAFIVAPDRLVHYQYSAEHTPHATAWKAKKPLAKRCSCGIRTYEGSCHVWINGEGETDNTGAVQIHLWDSAEAPSAPVEGAVYYLIQDCPGINKGSRERSDVAVQERGLRVEYAGDIMAQSL